MSNVNLTSFKHLQFNQARNLIKKLSTNLDFN
jgi:hypothetical protein